jgi:hypothetical protein
VWRLLPSLARPIMTTNWFNLEINGLRQLLAEKDAEIERLNAMETLARESNKQACETSSKLEAELERLKTATAWDSYALREQERSEWRALLARAADALESWDESPASCRGLIAELREAAKNSF